MGKTRKRVMRELLDTEERTDYAVEFGDSSIALQIKALRLKNGWTQAELGERAGMHQSRISDMEGVDYSSWSVTTLRRLACAFDLPLIVSFESWGKFLDDVLGMGRAALERPSIDEDPAFAETLGRPGSRHADLAALATTVRATSASASSDTVAEVVVLEEFKAAQRARPESRASHG